MFGVTVSVSAIETFFYCRLTMRNSKQNLTHLPQKLIIHVVIKVAVKKSVNPLFALLCSFPTSRMKLLYCSSKSSAIVVVFHPASTNLLNTASKTLIHFSGVLAILLGKEQIRFLNILYFKGDLNSILFETDDKISCNPFLNSRATPSLIFLSFLRAVRRLFAAKPMSMPDTYL